MYYHRRLCLAVLSPELEGVSTLSEKETVIERESLPATQRARRDLLLSEDEVLAALAANHPQIFANIDSDVVPVPKEEFAFKNGVILPHMSTSTGAQKILGTLLSGRNQLSMTTRLETLSIASSHKSKQSSLLIRRPRRRRHGL